MENEIKINDPYTQNQYIIDKLKSNKNVFIICGVLVGVLLCYALFESKRSDINISSVSSSTKLKYYYYFIVGSGLYGAIFNYLAKKAGKTTFVVEKRDFVNSLTHFNPYIQQTVANVDNKLYSLPFNMWIYNKLWGITTPEESRAKIDSQ